MSEVKQLDRWSKAGRRAWWASLSAEQQAAYVEHKMAQKAALRSGDPLPVGSVAEVLARATEVRLDQELRERVEREP